MQGARVVVAAVGDTGILPVVAAQRGEWEASRGAFCVVQKKAVAPADLGEAHVLVFRADRLGALVDVGALAVLAEATLQPAAKVATDSEEPTPSPSPDSSEDDPLKFDDVIPAFRDEVAKYGPDRPALPLGGTALVLVYDRSALEKDSRPPKTWDEFDALVKRLHQPTRAGIALAFGRDAEGVGNAVFLSRAATLGQHPHHYSLLFDSDGMEPRVTSPPFVEALEKLAALKAFAPEGAETFDANAARAAFRDGKAVFLIDRAEKATTWGGGKVKTIGVAALPGSPRVFDPSKQIWEVRKTPNRVSYLPDGGGWLVAVAASAKGRDREAALDLVKYLVNPETSNRLRSDREFPMLPVRGSQVSLGLPDPRAAAGVDSPAWADAVSATLTAPRVLPGLRIPGVDGYLADLDQHRASAWAGKTPVADALKNVADAWSARTKTLGAARQLWHYQRSLNHMTTTPRPPER